MCIFSEGEASIKGLQVIAIEKRIDEVTGFPYDGELFPKAKDARSAREELTHPANGPLSMDKQGTKRMSLPREWPQVAFHVMK